MISFPFTSQGGDRKVGTSDFRLLFSKYFTNGAFYDELGVTPSTGMKVKVGIGGCNINGNFSYLEKEKELTIETVSTKTVFNIVVRLDDTREVRNTDIFVVKGTSSPPQLTRNDTIYELCLARITVKPSDTSITLDMIEDTREKTDLCGIVANAVQVLDTDSYYQQLQGALDKFLDTVDQAIEGTTAGNLQKQINDYWKTIYKIGDVYITTNDDNPNIRFGGTWEMFSKGRVLVGYDADDTIFNEVEKTGGKKEQVLRASIGAVGNDTGSIGYANTEPTPNHNVYQMAIHGTPDTTPRAANHATEVWQADGTGPTTIQPYTVVKFWKRTA